MSTIETDRSKDAAELIQSLVPIAWNDALDIASGIGITKAAMRQAKAELGLVSKRGDDGKFKVTMPEGESAKMLGMRKLMRAVEAAEAVRKTITEAQADLRARERLIANLTYEVTGVQVGTVNAAAKRAPTLDDETIVEYVREHAECTARDVAKALGASYVTVLNHINAMLEGDTPRLHTNGGQRAGRRLFAS